LQGPCVECQRAAVTEKALDSAMRVLAWEQPDLTPGGLTMDEDKDMEEGVDMPDVRTAALVLLLAAVEGPVVPAHYDALMSAVDLRVLRARLATAYREGVESYARGGALGCVARRRVNGGADYDDAEVPMLDVLALPGGQWDENIVEGFNVYVLLEKLAAADPTGAVAFAVSVDNFSKDDAVAYLFFRRYTRCIEIVSAVGALERFYFPCPIECFHLSSASRQRWEWDVDRSSSQAKLDGLITASDEFIHEMTHQTWLSQIPLLSWVVLQFESLKVVSLALAFAINAILLFAYGVQRTTDPTSFATDILQGNITLAVEGNSILHGDDVLLALQVLGAAQTVTSTCLVIIFFINDGPLIARKRCGTRRSFSRSCACSLRAWRGARAQLEGAVARARRGAGAQG
jgi:hypothetical protein